VVSLSNHEPQVLRQAQAERVSCLKLVAINARCFLPFARTPKKSDWFRGVGGKHTDKSTRFIIALVD
jgi:hypothetical protein